MRTDGVDPGGAAALPAVLERVLASAPLDRAWIVNHAGKVLACVRRTEEPCPEGPALGVPAHRSPLQSLGRLLRPEGIVASAPILRGGAVVGAVRVDFTHEEVVGDARDLAWGASIVAAFWIFVGQLLAAIFLRGVTRPLVQLSEAAESLVEERRVQLEEPEERELAELVRAFNDMSRRLDDRRARTSGSSASSRSGRAEDARGAARGSALATLGGIAAGFAHEIGNSLNVIRGYASVAARELPPDAEVKSDVDAIRREVTRAAGLIERFLVFARARVHPIAQPVEPILREAVEVMGPAAARRTWSGSSRSPPICRRSSPTGSCSARRS